VNEAGVQKKVGVVPVLTEWQATQVNVDSDLNGDYQQHKSDGNELAEVVGASRIDQALAPGGNMQELQDEIIEKQREKIIQKQQEGVLDEGDLN
jgi:hypothetical protein